MAEKDSEIVSRARGLFAKTFPETEEASKLVCSSAPGRVNLIGEHTDYNDGFVLPLALDKVTVMVGCKRTGGQTTESRVACEAFAGQLVTIDTSSGDLKPGETGWANYVIGMMAQFLRNGRQIPAFDAVFVSDVPMGGGVSSSAALEMAVGTFLEGLTDSPLDKTEKAIWGQRCEHEFANVPCGIMDQLISSCGVEGHALLMDCRDNSTIPVSLANTSVCILVTNSNVQHQLSGSEYPERRDMCHQAAKTMNVKALRDANMDMLEAVKGQIGEVGYRRARHVITEDVRTLTAVEAFRSGDYATAGKLMYESHNSLRDDFEVSTKEIDVLVEIASSVEGVFGSRITGGGFGGSTVTLLQADAVEPLTTKIDSEYPAKTGLHAAYFVTTAGAGAHLVQL